MSVKIKTMKEAGPILQSQSKKEDLFDLYKSYLEAEKERNTEEQNLKKELKNKDPDLKRQTEIAVELSELFNEKIFNLEERYKIVKQILADKSIDSLKRNEMTSELNKLSSERLLLPKERYKVLKQIQEVDPNLLTEEQAKRLEYPMDITSGVFLKKLQKENPKIKSEEKAA